MSHRVAWHSVVAVFMTRLCTSRDFLSSSNVWVSLSAYRSVEILAASSLEYRRLASSTTLASSLSPATVTLGISSMNSVCVSCSTMDTLLARSLSVRMWWGLRATSSASFCFAFAMLACASSSSACTMAPAAAVAAAMAFARSRLLASAASIKSPVSWVFGVEEPLPALDSLPHPPRALKPAVDMRSMKNSDVSDVGEPGSSCGGPGLVTGPAPVLIRGFGVRSLVSPSIVIGSSLRCWPSPVVPSWLRRELRRDDLTPGAPPARLLMELMR
mmetsp:Transcript_13638/g.36880  ORF Transcript_13638/g.36880 Transcript_13638/m.36880 type:complete len:272 (-) Transcript_13638:256-1071(-)